MLDLTPLRSATFRHLVTGYWVNEFGNWIGEIALALLVYDRTGSPLATAALFLSLRFLPALLAPLVTTHIEASSPRLVLACLYLLEAAFFGGMAILAHRFSLAPLLGLCSLDGILAITAKALTRSANATWLLERDQLRQGNAILNLGVMVSSAAGPGIAGAAVAWKGASVCLVADAVSFVITAVVIATAPGLRVASDREAGFSGRLKAGIGVLRNYQAVRRLLIAIACVMMLGSIVIPIEVVFAKTTLHAGDDGYGFLLGAWGVGMIVGGFVFAAVSEIRLIRILAVGTVLSVLGYAGLAASPTLAVACGFSALGGIGNGAGWIAAVTAVQERIPITTQGAVMSVLEGINQLMPAIGYVIGGAITAASNPRWAYGISAGGVALVVILFAVKPIDRIRLTPVAESADNSGSRSERAPNLERDPTPNRQEMAAPERTLPVTNG